MWSEKLVTDAAVEPVDLPTVKVHLRVDHTADDDYINGLIGAARKYCERRTNLAFLSQQWDYYRDGWPVNPADRIYLPHGRLASVEAFEFTNSSEITTPVDPSIYKIDTSGTPGCIALKYSKIWPPDVLSTLNAIHVRFTGASWATPLDIPASVRHAILLCVGHWYEHRESVFLGAQAIDSKIMKMAVDDLLADYRCSQFGQE